MAGNYYRRSVRTFSKIQVSVSSNVPSHKTLYFQVWFMIIIFTSGWRNRVFQNLQWLASRHTEARLLTEIMGSDKSTAVFHLVCFTTLSFDKIGYMMQMSMSSLILSFTDYLIFFSFYLRHFLENPEKTKNAWPTKSYI